MFRYSAFALLCATLALTAAASAKPAAPVTSTFHLSGAYACSGTDKDDTETHVWSSTMGGTWLSGMTGSYDNLVTHDARAHVWRVASLARNGDVVVFEAPDTNSTHVVFNAVYPASVKQTTTFDQVSPAKYTLTFDGVFKGKKFHDVTTCTKK